MAPYSTSNVKSTNTAYRANIVPPSVWFNFHPNDAMQTMTKISIMKSRNNEKSKEELSTLFGSPPVKIDFKSQGRGKPTRTSKMFDPIEDETAMSPNPWRATITELNKSGTDVPAARKVRPMTGSGMPTAAPKVVAHHTIK